MEQVVLVIHIILALAIIGLVLIQRSEGGGLGIGGGGGGGGSFGNLTTAKGAANILTRLTAIFTAGFFITSLTLAVMAKDQQSVTSILDEQAPASALDAGAEGDQDTQTPDEPIEQTPQVPISE